MKITKFDIDRAERVFIVNGSRKGRRKTKTENFQEGHVYWVFNPKTVTNGFAVVQDEELLFISFSHILNHGNRETLEGFRTDFYLVFKYLAKNLSKYDDFETLLGILML